MDRENYYILLDLDPSVSDTRVIESRIAEKEKKWRDLFVKTSRPQYEQYLRLIPDMRSRMLDPQARKAEANAAMFASAANPAKLKAALDELPENYAKIEGMLNGFQHADIYDFLYKGLADAGCAGHGQPANNAGALIALAKELMEVYRNQSATDKMTAASLIARFLDSGYKDAYDAYMLLSVKASLCHDIDTLAKLNKLDGSVTAQMLAGCTRPYFRKQDVQSFIDGYCAYKGYPVGQGANQKKHPNPAREPYTPPEPTRYRSLAPAPQHTDYRPPNSPNQSKTYRDQAPPVDYTPATEFIETVVKGQKAVRGTLGFGALNWIGIKAWVCVGLGAACFTVVAAPFAAPLGVVIGKTLWRGDHFVGFGTVIKGMLITFAEAAAVFFIGLVIDGRI